MSSLKEDTAAVYPAIGKSTMRDKISIHYLVHGEEKVQEKWPCEIDCPHGLPRHGDFLELGPADDYDAFWCVRIQWDDASDYLYPTIIVATEAWWLQNAC